MEVGQIKLVLVSGGKRLGVINMGAQGFNFSKGNGGVSFRG